MPTATHCQPELPGLGDSIVASEFERVLGAVDYDMRTLPKDDMSTEEILDAHSRLSLEAQEDFERRVRWAIEDGSVDGSDYRLIDLARIPVGMSW